MFYEYNGNLTQNAKSLRKNMTAQERKLWHCFLKTYPVRVLRQKQIGNYIVDFYCAAAQLAIEIDGNGHETSQGMEYDRIRTEVFNISGVGVIRFTNRQVDCSFDQVCADIDREIASRLAQQPKDSATMRSELP